MPLIDNTGQNAPRAKFSVRPLDVLIVALSAAALAALSFAVYGGPASATLVVSTDAAEWLYPLSENREIIVEGLIGQTIIHIENGAAHIDDSPCANKTCIASPPISSTGEWSACLPNGVFIRIEGSEDEDGIDASVR